MDIFYRINLSKAFGNGSDARLQGVSIESNPHEPNTSLHFQWQLGWKDVDKNWGKDVGYRWIIRPLPDVKRTNHAHALQQSETFSSLSLCRYAANGDSVEAG